MSGRHSQKTYDKPFLKILMVPFVALLAFLSVLTGVQAGDILYRLNANLIENVDTETLRDTMRLSLPIIENVYNNGKSSTSLTGEIKSLFASIFEFDLDSPMTILNVQSPLFMSYYNNHYKTMLARDNGQTDGNQLPEIPGNAGNGENNGNAGNSGSNRNIGNGNIGNNGGSGDGTAGSPTTDDSNRTEAGSGNTGKSNGSSQGNGNGNEANGKGTDLTGKKTEDNSDDGTTNGVAPLIPEGNIIDLQPISSITYEAEDEEEQNGSDTVASDKVIVKNFTKHKIDIAKLLSEPLNLKFDKRGPKVLVYHTHASESYVLKEQDLGKKNVASYNSNPKYSVVRVGEELARNLRKYGIDTLHNGTVHDKVRNAAYGVAINTLLSYKKSYPSIKVFIDIHRDGLDASKPKLRITKKINGKNAAQIMFVVGTDDMLPHPGWQENLKFALKVQQKLNEKYPGLARPIWMVGKRYNQQVSNQAVLIEVGGDGNLLSECLESTKYIAEALNEVMKGK